MPLQRGDFLLALTCHGLRARSGRCRGCCGFNHNRWAVSKNRSAILFALLETGTALDERCESAARFTAYAGFVLLDDLFDSFHLSSHCSRAGYFMLPNPNNDPPFFAKCAGDRLVTFGITRDFPIPVITIGGWFSAMLRATVPKTTIDKDGNSLSWKTKVWGADNGVLSPPA